MGEIEDYEILETLGQGHQGRVQKVKRIRSGEILAVKIFDDIYGAEREIEVLKELSTPECHPLILCYHGAIDLDGSVGMLTEYVQGYTLEEAVKYQGIKDDQLILLARYIFEGLAYIHSKGIVHNDISPANFIFD